MCVINILETEGVLFYINMNNVTLVFLLSLLFCKLDSSSSHISGWWNAKPHYASESWRSPCSFILYFPGDGLLIISMLLPVWLKILWLFGVFILLNNFTWSNTGLPSCWTGPRIISRKCHKKHGWNIRWWYILRDYVKADLCIELWNHLYSLGLLPD